jgi:hypothetical protein
MKTFALIATFALTLANTPLYAGCDILEDPPISEANCENEVQAFSGGDKLSAGPDIAFVNSSDWTRTLHNDVSKGLRNVGSLTMSARLERTADSVLVGKIQAAKPILRGKTLRAVVDDSAWVDVILQRSGANNTLELVSYRYVNGAPQAQSSVTSAPFANLSGQTVAFEVSYSFNAGALNATLNAPGAAQISLTSANFGNVLPSIRLRRGVQPSDSGVTTANFTRGAYSSQ